LFYLQRKKKMSRYSSLKGPTVPWGYRQSEDNKYILEPIEEQLEALEQAEKYLKQSSYTEVARWLTDYTGRKISSMGLWKRMKKDKADRRRHGQQKRYSASDETQVNV